MAVTAALVCATASIASTARAEESGLRIDWRVDGAVTAAAFAFWGGTQLFESRLAPADCRWCDPGSLDASVRDTLRWNDTSAANLASNLGAYVFVPLTSLGLLALDVRSEGRLGELPGDGLVIAEAVALNGALTQIVKFAIGRERPLSMRCRMTKSRSPHTPPTTTSRSIPATPASLSRSRCRPVPSPRCGAVAGRA